MIDLDAGDGQPGRLPALGERQQPLDNGFLVQLRQLAVEARYQPERAAVLLQQAEIGRDFPPAFARMHLQRQHAQRRTDRGCASAHRRAAASKPAARHKPADPSLRRA